MGLGGGCALVGEGLVVGMSKGSIVELLDGVANNNGGPSASLLLGIADRENVDLWCLSIVASERVGIRLRDDTRRSIGELVGGETVSGEDSVIVRLRLGVDTPEGVTVGSPEAGRRSRDS
jgi:hypothetical protein